MNLSELQQNFFDAIFNKKSSQAFLAQIQATKHRSAERALEIYRNSIIGNYIACLKQTYPVCYQLVGEDFFVALANCYIAQAPSYSENLNHYGEEFSQFIKSFAHTQSIPYLSDVAHLEWLCHCVMQAEDSPKLENEHWQSLLIDEQLEQIVFCLPKALALMRSNYPVQRIWHVHQVSNVEQQIDLDSGGNQLVIFRQGEHIALADVSEPMWLLLNLIAQQKTFDEICIAFSEKNFNVVSLIPEAVKQQWVIGFAKQGC